MFGPSIVRKSNDSLEMVVKDMRHQCQIVESLISNVRSLKHSSIVSRGILTSPSFCLLSSFFQYGYFFENEPMPMSKTKIYQASNNDSGSELPSADFLLENVAKIERKINIKNSIPLHTYIHATFIMSRAPIMLIFYCSFIVALTKDIQKDTSSRFVANIVQAANRKIRKTAQRRSTSSSMTPDSLSLESMTTVSNIAIKVSGEKVSPTI